MWMALLQVQICLEQNSIKNIEYDFSSSYTGKYNRDLGREMNQVKLVGIYISALQGLNLVKYK